MANNFYTLFIKNNNLNENLNLDQLSSLFTYTIDEKKSQKEVMYDLVLDSASLELSHGFNEEVILKLNDINGFSQDVHDEVINQIQKMDFDIALAIEMLGGSNQVFKNILINYLNEYSNIDETINELLETNDFDSIRKIIHKIKGVSLYLGSEKLLYIATLTEQKIYDLKVTKEDIRSFINYHNRMLEYIRKQV